MSCFEGKRWRDTLKGASRVEEGGEGLWCVPTYACLLSCACLGPFFELWQCPICLKNYSLENIIIDPYFNRITSLMQYCGEDVTEIEVKLDGSWRPKVGTVGGDLGQWHLPDGTLCVLTDVEVKPKMELSKQIKQEGVSEGHTGLKLGIKKNRNGYWEVIKPEEMYVNSLAKRCF